MPQSGESQGQRRRAAPSYQFVEQVENLELGQSRESLWLCRCAHITDAVPRQTKPLKPTKSFGQCSCTHGTNASLGQDEFLELSQGQKRLGQRYHGRITEAVVGQRKVCELHQPGQGSEAGPLLTCVLLDYSRCLVWALATKLHRAYGI